MLCCWLAAVFLLVKIKFFEDRSFGVVFFDIGQGDSSLIRFENGQKMLVDCGPDKGVLFKLGKYLPFYDRTLDYLVITHFDLDHYGGCVDVLKRYQVKNIFINSDRKTDDFYYLEWEKQTRQENAAVKIMEYPSDLKIAKSHLEFLWPNKNLAKGFSGNDNSIVFRLVHDQNSFLFTGDMGVEAEKILLENYCSSSPTDCEVLNSEVLKAGHHGSDTSSSDEFLRAINPSKAVISVGENSFGHPSLRVLSKLKRIGAEIFRTDEMGDVCF